VARIEGAALYELVGWRDAVVAPDACAGIRPAEARENLLMLLSDDGRHGVAHWPAARNPTAVCDLGWLVGVDPRALFDFSGSRVRRSHTHAERLRTVRSLDVALLDLCAQAEGVPVWRLLGGEARPTVPAYDSTLYFEDLVSDESGPEHVVARAHQAIARGHRRLKIKVGRGHKWMEWPACTERDVEVALAVREAVGPKVELMVDANGGYTDYIEDAADFLTETACCRFVWAEEMVAGYQVAGLKAALKARGLEIPLAGGEGASTAAWCRESWPSVPLDVLQMDMCATGFLEWLEIADFACEHGLRIAPHNFGTQLGVAASLHLGKAVAEYLYCETDDSRFDAYRLPGFVLAAGEFSVPDSPGLGVVIEDPRDPPPA